ncbi:MAG: STT3 domain-containing protein [Thermodesulfobacteriota bacterium]
MPDIAWVQKYRIHLEIAALLLVLAIGLFVRLDDLRQWQAQPERAFFQEEPLLTNQDGYYYLYLARDLVQGTYDAVDEKRAVPDYPKRPTPPPLLSVLAAAIQQVTGASLNWIAVIVPALLGVLLALPVYLFGRICGGPVMGITAALTALLSEYYVYRSGLGWFDTDGMNVTFTMASAALFLCFALVREKRRYGYLVAGFACCVLFLWWWDSTPYVVIAISLAPLLLALLFFYRPPVREGGVVYGLIGLGVLLSLFWLGWDAPLRVVKAIVSQFGYIAKEASESGFPNMSISVSEQERSSLLEIVSMTTQNVFVFFLAVLGLIALAVRKPKESVFLLVPVALALLSLLYADRFLIFLAPVLGLGLGFVVATVWRLQHKWAFCAVLAPLLVIGASAPAMIKNIRTTYWPKMHPLVISGMDVVARQTPENAVVWAWWDVGYPLRYWGDRGTVSDGTYHGGELAVYNAIPLATDDFRLSANFIQFYATRGEKGVRELRKALGNDKAKTFTFLKQVLAAGPEEGRAIVEAASLSDQGGMATTTEWLTFFFPPNPPPLYLFLESRLIVTDYWWYWLGTWDVAKGEGERQFYKPFSSIEITNTYARSASGLDVDLVAGYANNVQGQRLPLKDIILRSDGGKMKKHTFHPDGLNFEIFLPMAYGVLTTDKIAESVFNKLYQRHVAPKTDYFRPVNLLTPAYQLWVVKGDKIGAAEATGKENGDVSR